MGYRGAEQNKQHLRFDKIAPVSGGKMHRYRVINTTLNYSIGLIHWRGGWRQYVFRAEAETDMSRGCNKEVNAFIDKLMAEWRRSIKAKR